MDLTHFSEEDPLGSELICSNFSLLLEVKFGVGTQSGQGLGTGEKNQEVSIQYNYYRHCSSFPV